MAQRIVEAAAVLPGGGAVTGWAALHWMGARWFGGTSTDGSALPVPLATAGTTLRPRPGIAVCEEGLDQRDVWLVDGLRVTTPVRSACFEMRYALGDWAAVAVADMTAYSDLASLDELADYAGALSGWTGIPRCRNALPFADENAWSPTEVTMRRWWHVEGDLDRPLCNHPVFDRQGRHLGTPDLIDPVAGVIGEYDGSGHLASIQRGKDVRREAAFRAVGLEVVTMTSIDLIDPSHFIQRLRAAYSRAERMPVEGRQWTVELPRWWQPTHRVDLRRELSAAQRERLLRYRSAA